METAQPPRPARYEVVGRGLTLSVFDVGLACCAVEFAAATFAHPDLVPLTGDDASDAPQIMVVSGTLTDKLAPTVLAAYRRIAPRYVMSFGACAASGGPYWDSYSVTKGVDQLIPVDVYVPGCPPRPEALLQGIDVLASRIAS